MKKDNACPSPQDETPEIWTINFDLDTNNPSFKDTHYSTIHNFLKQHHFKYRQHSGDISTRKMLSYKVIRTLDALYAMPHKIGSSYFDMRRKSLITENKTCKGEINYDS